MFKLSPEYRQFVAVFVCHLLTFAFGTATGYAPINFNDFQSENTTFPSGKLNLEEASLVVSLIHFGGLLGNFAVLPLSQIIGVKQTIHLFGVPLILSIVLIIWAQNVYYLYASRLLSGLVGGAVSVGIPTFIDHIASSNVRGALNSLFDPMNNIGFSFSFFLGSYFNWLDEAKIQLIVPITFMILMFILPESPEYLTNRNIEKKAIRSRRFYGSVEPFENIDLENIQCEKLQKFDKAEPNTKITYKDFLTKHAKNAFFISFAAITLYISTCSIVILSYVNDIFTKSGSSLSPKSSSLLISITQIATNLVFLSIVDRVNRRTLLIGSAILTSVGFCIFGIYCILWIGQPEYKWIPTVIFPCIVFFSWMGMNPLPFIITIELLPKKLLQLGLALAASLMWILFFIFNEIFPFLLEYFGLFYCMIAMAVLCLEFAIFAMLFIPETRGKSSEQIAALFSEESS